LLLLKIPVKEQLWQEHTRAKHNPGEDTLNTSHPFVLKMILSSTSLTDNNATRSCVALPWLCITDDIQDSLMIDWLREQSVIPSQMFA
jgi:hypothetical protein